MSESFTTSPFAAAREIAQCYEEIGEKEAEIEWLKKRLEEFSQKETYKEWQRNQRVIGELKALLTRAADALDNPRAGSEAKDDDFDLITELRKAV